jgi:hypothetical protein
MKAYVMTGTGTITGGPYEDPSVPLVDVVPPGQGIVTQDPSQVGKPVAQPSTRSNTFTGEKLAKWVQTGAALEKAAKEKNTGIDLGGFNFGALAAAMGIGATIGGTFGTVTLPLIGTAAGAVVGAVIGAVVYVATFVVSLFNRPPREWANAGPGVHIWFTNFGPQEYLDWVRDSAPGILGSIEDCIKGVAPFWLERYGYVLTPTPGRSFYSGIPDVMYCGTPGSPLFNHTREFYESVGIDYRKTWLESLPAGTMSSVSSYIGPDEYGNHEVSQGLGGVWQKNWKIMVPPSASDLEDDEPKGPDTISGKNNTGLLVVLAAGVYLSQAKLK